MTYNWRSGLKPSIRDPRLWIGSVVTGAALWLFLSAPDDADLKGIYVASSIALGVAALPQAILALTEHAHEGAMREEQERKDLDETRRILLMALAIGTAGEHRAEVAATTVNALAYHSSLLPPAEAQDILGQFHAGGDQQERIQNLVDDLCIKLGDPPMFRARQKPPSVAS
jgi:hypothetical protein